MIMNIQSFSLRFLMFLQFGPLHPAKSYFPIIPKITKIAITMMYFAFTSPEVTVTGFYTWVCFT